MMVKKKILFIIPSLVGGGAERTLINLLSKIDYNLFDIELFSVLAKGPYLTEVPANVKLTTLYKNELWLKIITKLHQKFHFNFFFKRKIQKKMNGNYDVGISFLDGVYTEFLHLNKNINKKYAWIHCSYKSYINFSKFYKDEVYCQRIKKYRYDLLDGLIFVSQDALEEFELTFGKYKNMQVLYNIINVDSVIQKSMEQINLEEYNDLFNFVAIGSLIPVKGFDRLIRSSSILKQKGKKFKVHILGNGYQENELKKLIKELGLEEVVFFKGFQKNPYPHLKAANSFIMSSNSEALPTVLCEAMILSKPTIVTNCSGCREIVNMGEFGLMAEQNDEDLANKMAIFIDDKNICDFFTNKSIERSAIFDDELILSKIMSILNS